VTLDRLMQGAAAARKSGDIAGARSFLCAAATVQPDRAAAYVNILGLTMMSPAERRDPDTKRWLVRLRTVVGADSRIARNLGVAATHAGHADLGNAYLRRALLLDPGDAAAWRLWGAERPGASSVDAAVVLLNPDDGDLLRACVLRATATGSLASAPRLFDKAHGVDWSEDPVLIEIHADAFLAAGRLEDARAGVERAVAERPNSAMAWFRFAILSRKSGDLSVAYQALYRACVLSPGAADAFADLGRVHLKNKRYLDAIVELRRARVAAGEDRATIAKNHAAALVALRRSAEAFPVLQRLLIAKPDDLICMLNLAVSEQFRLDFPAAERWVRRALTMAPMHGEGLYNGGLIARYAGDHATAMRRFNTVVQLYPDNPSYRYHRAWQEMQDGERARGISEYRWRNWMEEFSAYRRLGPERSLPQPLWDLTPVPGKRVAIWGEQGVGDEIWFSQFLNAVRDRVGSVVLEVSAKLVPLLQRAYPWVEVKPRFSDDTETAMAEADLQLPLGDLVALCDEQQPRAGFLKPNADLTDAIRRSYERRFPGCRLIGISWRSVKPAAEFRSFEAELAHWRPIFERPNTQVICLQYAPRQSDFDAVAEAFGQRLWVDPRVDAMDDLGALAAQIASLDAVVSVANATVALAHGVGVPTYVPLRALQDDFRYPHNAAASYWLPGVRFAWAPVPDRWDEAIADLAGRLGADLGQE
jgi:tetratricopeptide (TPR) repeat protein